MKRVARDRGLWKYKENKVKRLIILAAIACLLLIAQTSFARGNQRATINRMWKEAQEQQKQQDESLKRFLKDSDRSSPDIRDRDDPVQRVPDPGCRTCP